MGQPNIPLISSENIFAASFISHNIFTNKLTVLLIFAIVLSALLNYTLKTDFGIAMRCTGNNETMARANGVNTQRMKIMGLAMANGFTALSGYLMVQYQGFADINMGIGIVISGLAAVMIGETLLLVFTLRSILWKIIFVMVGTISFRLILAFALSLGLNPNYLKLTTALIVLTVLVAARIRKTNEA
jgi:putative ABC transport system permease protein